MNIDQKIKEQIQQIDVTDVFNALVAYLPAPLIPASYKTIIYKIKEFEKSRDPSNPLLDGIIFDTFDKYAKAYNLQEAFKETVTREGIWWKSKELGLSYYCMPGFNKNIQKDIRTDLEKKYNRPTIEAMKKFVNDFYDLSDHDEVIETALMNLYFKEQEAIRINKMHEETPAAWKKHRGK